MFFYEKIRPARTVQLGNLRKLVENATYSHSEYNVEHKKFIDFHYYDVSARYNGETYNLWLNVGVAKNDGTNHIYAITNKEAPTNNGVSRPVGYAIQNASSTNSISQTEEKSNTFEKKFRNEQKENSADVSEQSISERNAFTNSKTNMANDQLLPYDNEVCQNPADAKSQRQYVRNAGRSNFYR